MPPDGSYATFSTDALAEVPDCTQWQIQELDSETEFKNSWTEIKDIMDSALLACQQLKKMEENLPFLSFISHMTHMR